MERGVLFWGKIKGNIDWFVGRMVRKFGWISQAFFWKDAWLGSIPSKSKFTSLFFISLKSDGLVEKRGVVVKGVLTWDLIWWKTLVLRDISTFYEFLSLFQNVILILDRDKWIWKHFKI